MPKNEDVKMLNLIYLHSSFGRRQAHTTSVQLSARIHWYGLETRRLHSKITTTNECEKRQLISVHLNATTTAATKKISRIELHAEEQFNFHLALTHRTVKNVLHMGLCPIRFSLPFFNRQVYQYHTQWNETPPHIFDWMHRPNKRHSAPLLFRLNLSVRSSLNELIMWINEF